MAGLLLGLSIASKHPQDRGPRALAGESNAREV
jgi:hypothetical protein